MVQRVIVLGGGSAGFMAAGALKRVMPDLDVLVIRSKDIGIIGVGEGSTIALTDFLHQLLKVKPKTFFDVARPTWKLGLKFIWGPRPYFHYGFGGQADSRMPPLLRNFGYYVDEHDAEYWDTYSALMTHEKVFVRGPGGWPAVHLDLSYHFENEKFAEFLEGYAKAWGARVMDDTVQEVLRDESGVTGLVLKGGTTQTADLYVDASGFYSLLLGKTLGEPLVDFKSSLFCDRAVVGGWARQEGDPIRPYTTCETMNSGWCWQIEHERRVNRGYVYSSAFISDEEAEREFRAVAPLVGPTRIVKFVSGRYQRGWVKNVVAIGNSSGFVEPLEATALGVIAMQCRLLAGSLFDSQREVRRTHIEQFNRHHERLWDSIRGFIAMHYKFNTRVETPFWRECWEKTDLAGAAEFVEFYQENGPSSFWGPTLLDPLEPFKTGGYTTLLVGMNVPYRKRYTPTAEEAAWWAGWRARNRRLADGAMTVAEALDAVHSPGWEWGRWGSGKAIYFDGAERGAGMSYP
jgi:tryptophan halogenase